MAYTTRPDQVAARDRQINDLMQLNSQLTSEIRYLQTQNLLNDEAAEPDLSYDELCDAMECADDKLKKQMAILVELKSAKARNRFRDKCLMPLYCKLLEIQDAIVILCNKDLADLNFQLWCHAAEGADVCIDESTQDVCDILNETPVDDWYCKDLIDGVVGKRIQEAA